MSGINRRRFLGAVGTGLAVTSVQGLGTAKESAVDRKQIPFVVDGERIELAATTRGGKAVSTKDVLQRTTTNQKASADSFDSARGEKSRSPASIVRRALRSDEQITGWDAAVVLSHGAKKLNEVSKQGYVNFKDTGQNVAVVPTQKLSARHDRESSTGATGEGATIQSCGVTKYEFDGPGLTDPWLNHDIYTNDSDTERLKARLTQGGMTVGALGTILGVSSFGVGTPVLIACAILTAASGVIAVELGLQNDGCGVLTEIGHLPAQPGVPIPELTYDFSITGQ